jgi:small subunit ribosomal protein S4
MSKYCGPRLRIVRRFGELPSLTRKFPNRLSRPGQHGTVRRKPTQFAYRLTEKQKLRFYYGLSEKQLVRYVKVARKSKGSTRQILLQNLEIRLDIIVYRLGWECTLPAARQLVNHGNILVNQNSVDIPSFSCIPKQIIAVRAVKNIQTLVGENLKECIKKLPSHLSFSDGDMVAVVKHFAAYNEIVLDLNDLLIIEYYSDRLSLLIFFS